MSNMPVENLNFLNLLAFPTFTSNGTNFSYFHQQVTFSGTATIVAPGGTPQPYADQPIVLSNLDTGTNTAITTAADGSFTATITAQAGTHWSTPPMGSTAEQGSSQFITLTVTPLKVRSP